MADNKKKPKLSFADQLKAQVDKTVPAKSDPRSKETVLVNVGGEMVPIARGDMNDAVWAKVKARAEADAPKPKQELQLPVEISADRPASKLTEDEKQKKTIPASSIDAISKDLSTIADSVISAEEKATLEKTAPENRVGFIRERLKKRGYEVTEPEATPTVKVVDQKPDQGTPDEWKSPEPSMKKTGGTQTEEDTFVGSRPGSVQGRVASMMMGGIPETQAKVDQTVNDAVNSAALPLTPDQQRAQQRQAEMDANVARVNAQGEQHGQEDLQTLKNVNEAVGNAMWAPAKALDQGVENIMRPVGQFVKSDIGALQQLGLPGYLKETGRNIGQAMAPSPEQQPAPAPVEPPALHTVPPSHADPTGKVSISGKVPGQGVAPASQIDDPVAAIREETEKLAEIERLKAGNAAEMIKSEAEILRTQQVERAKLDADRQKELVAQQAEMQKYENGLRDLQAQVLDLSKQTINPNQFYDSMDTGQRVSSVIAGALFGFTGQGMQWLQRLDSLAERSVQAQAADLNRKRGLLSDATQIQGNLVAMAEKRGLQGKAAYDAALISLKENIASQIELNAMNFTQPALKLQSQEMVAKIRMSAAKDIASYQTQAQQAAMDARLKQAQINHLNAQTFKIGTDKGEDRKLPPGTREEVAKLDKGLAAVKEVREALEGDRLQDVAASTFAAIAGFGNPELQAAIAPDVTGRTAVAESGQETILKAVMGEALQEKDIERNRPRFARPGLTSENTKWLDAQEKILKEKRNALVRNANEGDLSLMSTESPINFTPSK